MATSYILDCVHNAIHYLKLADHYYANGDIATGLTMDCQAWVLCDILGEFAALVDKGYSNVL